MRLSSLLRVHQSNGPFNVTMMPDARTRVLPAIDCLPGTIHPSDSRRPARVRQCTRGRWNRVRA